MDYILIFFFFIILLVLVIFGLPIGRTSFNDEVRDIQGEVIRENFETKAPSTFSEWSDMSNNKFVPDMVSSENETVHSDDVYGNASYLGTDDVDKVDKVKSGGDCSKCNATQCKNIDKYILKSSVPPCPDLSNYILKSEIPPFPNMNDYIRKNEIPSCPTCPNMNDYIPKNQIPVCPTCPDLNDYMLKSKIPVCEKCPTCPKEYKNITENPEFKKWLAEYEKIVEDKINKNYISKKESSKEVEQAYKNGEVETYKEIARRFQDINFIDFIKKKLSQVLKSDVKEERRDQNNRVFQEERRDQNNRVFQEEESMDQKDDNKKKSDKYQTSYNTTNMNEIYNKWNTNFDNTYDGKVNDNNYSNFADWNKNGLLLEKEYYNDIATACDFS